MHATKASKRKIMTLVILVIFTECNYINCKLDVYFVRDESSSQEELAEKSKVRMP